MRHRTTPIFNKREQRILAEIRSLIEQEEAGKRELRQVLRRGRRNGIPLRYLAEAAGLAPSSIARITTPNRRER